MEKNCCRDFSRVLENAEHVTPFRKKARMSQTGTFSDQVKSSIRELLTTQQELSFGNAATGEGKDEGENHDNDDPVTGSSYVQSIPLGQFPVTRQSQMGPHHGKGGRRRGPPVLVRREHVASDITKVFARTIISICGGSIHLVIEAMKKSVGILYPDYEWNSGTTQFITTLLMDLGTGKGKEMYEVFPAPYFAVSMKLPYSQTGANSLFPMDRHAICAWLGEGGRTYCTCIGSTSFRIALQVQGEQMTSYGDNIFNGAQLCAHVIGINALVTSMSKCVELSYIDTAKVFLDLYARKYPVPLATYVHMRPRLTMVHNDNVAIISEIAPGTTRTVQFTPIRIVRKGAGGYVCAFCDTVLRQGCHHTRTLRHTRKENEEEAEDPAVIDDNSDDHVLPGDETFLIGEQDGDLANRGRMGDHRSQLPLSPVNCPASLKVDLAVADCVMKREPYVLRAPATCANCEAHRNPKSVGYFEAIIMCTLGPCVLQMEMYTCSNGNCGRTIESEGRDQCILIDKCTAATHVLLRRELVGVVMGNGTMNGRLRQYHSSVMSLIEAKILPVYPPCRSVRVLHRMCTIMLKLMVLDPEKTLFVCSNCDGNAEASSRERSTLCIDGINQGYLRRKQVLLRNISEPCSSVTASSRCTNGKSERPLITFLRRQETRSILFNAITGNTIMVDVRNVKDVAAVIRLVAPKLLPPQFCAESICGRTRNDSYNDIGDCPVLFRIGKITTALFHADTLLHRLVKPLNTFIRQCILEGKTVLLKNLGALPRERGHVPSRYEHRRTTLTSVIDRVLHRLEHGEMSNLIMSGVCWRHGMRGDTAEQRNMINLEDSLREVMDMYKMFLNGPITQFIRRSDILSIRLLANICKFSSPNKAWLPLLNVLNMPSIISGMLSSTSDTNFLDFCRTFRAAAFNIVQVERSLSEDTGRAAREGLGHLLSAASFSVQDFYLHYDDVKSTHSAVLYASRWKGESKDALQGLMTARFPDQKHLLQRNPFDSACISGFYFPNYPQVRPLPFNTDEVVPDRDLVPCTKKYAQNQNSYTPGSVTVSCCCPNTITYGLKVLSRDEGTKCILDTVISRFARYCRYIIYDFSCGLYQSAVHSLWWAIQNTVIVSDKFHAKNHTCSPGFFPNAYTELDHANTVAHEQRNRGIADLCKSLRNSSQHFYIGLIAYHTIIMNIRAKARTTERYATRDRLLSDYDLEWCFFHCPELKCVCCPGIP